MCDCVAINWILVEDGISIKCHYLSFGVAGIWDKGIEFYTRTRTIYTEKMHSPPFVDSMMCNLITVINGGKCRVDLDYSKTNLQLSFTNIYRDRFALGNKFIVPVI